MPILHTALPAEASVVRKILGLKSVERFRSLEIYRAGDIVLVVGGVGKVATATAIAYASTKWRTAGDFFLNIGIAGSLRNDWVRGSAFWVNQVCDLATGHSYYPDLIHRYPFPFARLGTSERPVQANSFGTGLGGMPSLDDVDLIDMEGSAFFQSALYFTQTHRIHSCKIVSDHLEGVRCQPQDVVSWSETVVPPLMAWLEDWMDWDRSEKADSVSGARRPPPESEYRALHEKITENLHLSFTQQKELEKALVAGYLRKSSFDFPFDSYLYQEGETKEKTRGKEKFKKLLAGLYHG